RGRAFASSRFFTASSAIARRWLPFPCHGHHGAGDGGTIDQPATARAHSFQRLRRPVHRRARSARAAGRAADVDRHVQHQPDHDPVGVADLRSALDRHRDHGGAPRRSVRPAALLCQRISAIRSRLRALRFCPGRLADHSLSRSAGGRRRDDLGQRPRRRLDRVSFRPARQGDGLCFHGISRGFLTGPTLGGFLIDTVGWRWIFFINLPVGIWGALLAWRLLEESKENLEDISVDLPGALLLMLTCSLFIFGMNEMPHVGWRDPGVAAPLALSALALALFVIVELRAAMPILNFSLFRIRLFTASMFSLFFITSTQSAISFLMPFYLQDVLGFSPSQMGWIIIANSV